MVLLHWLPLLAELTLASPAPRAATAPPSFSAWFDARAAEEKPEVLTRYQVDLDGDGRDDEVVCYRFGEKAHDPDALIPVVLVGLARGERFALGQMDVQWPSECPLPPARGSDLSLALQLRSRSTTSSAQLSLLVDRNGPMLLRSVVGGPQCTTTVDFRTAISRSRCDSPDAEEALEDEEPVLSISGAKPLELPSRVTGGTEHWEGKGDADLKVLLRRRGAVLTVVARLTDDKSVFAKSTQSEAILAADHLELRWPDGDAASGSVKLAIARPQKGTPTALWLAPPRRTQTPPPAIRWTTPERVEVDLPLSWLLLDRPSEVGNLYGELISGRPYLAVVFGDGDGEGPGTRVTAYSRFFVVEPGRRFPALVRSLLPWRSVGEAATLRSLVH
ncbi:hypothetical protein [Myxococcus landrumensis]|uniref:Lipoprotein n=1 Tax=Myxococcus landrumensis TaxID=2813577 RepID=A0ABX7N6X2_9BACT|nr:hypothetical protein [Myxococcus landrumus]QSQ14388.1 hypothetical protein JY572_39855 [Myxococcus landrumus]